MPSFLGIADFLQPQSLELGSTFIYGVRIVLRGVLDLITGLYLDNKWWMKRFSVSST